MYSSSQRQALSALDIQFYQYVGLSEILTPPDAKVSEGSSFLVNPSESTSSHAKASEDEPSFDKAANAKSLFTLIAPVDADFNIVVVDAKEVPSKWFKRFLKNVSRMLNVEQFGVLAPAEPSSMQKSLSLDEVRATLKPKSVTVAFGVDAAQLDWPGTVLSTVSLAAIYQNPLLKRQVWHDVYKAKV